VKKNIPYIMLTLLLLISFKSQAQVQTMVGTVTDFGQNPVEGAVIILYDDAQNIVGHTITDRHGNYQINQSVKLQYLVEVSHLSFAKKEYSIDSIAPNNATLRLDFVLEETSKSLEEVVFVAKRERRDTVHFDLATLDLLEDDKLKDIIEKIPDFRLGDDGTIIYKGKNIDKILVNNKPSFESQNSIALEGIENKIIEGISLINNYSNNFNVDFNENEESVINIDTKNKNQKIIKGDLLANVGLQDKYHFEGKGFLFSRNINAFGTHNTNNIGKTSFNSKEIVQLFSKGQPFSPYQRDGLGTLFASSENLERDFFTSTNLTVRNQTQRFKISGLVYHIAPDRINSTLQSVGTLDNTPLINTSSRTLMRTQALLGAFAAAYKVSDRTILKYRANTNLISKDDTHITDNEIFIEGLKKNNNLITANSNHQIFSGFHQARLESKVASNMIFESEGTYFHEETGFQNGYAIEGDQESLDVRQNFNFSKREVSGKAGLKYKFSESFIPLLTAAYHRMEENILTASKDQVMTDRTIDNVWLNAQIRGKEVINGLNYGIDIGYMNSANLINNENQRDEEFVPSNSWIEYDYKMHRYHLSHTNSREFNTLESGLTLWQPFNALVIGNGSLPLFFSTSSRFLAKYNYDNIFDGQMFELSFSYDNQRNSIRRAFLGQLNGVSEFQLFSADNARAYKISTFYSKTLFPLKFPTKVDLTLDLSRSTYPMLVGQSEFGVVSDQIAPHIKIETITRNAVNVRLSSNILFVEDDFENAVIRSTFMSSAFSVLLKKKEWKGQIDFRVDHNRISDQILTRRNINFKGSHTRNLLTYFIEARHIGELLGFFENDAYNSQFFVMDGITNTIVNNQSLSYLILGIKINL